MGWQRGSRVVVVGERVRVLSVCVCDVLDIHGRGFFSAGVARVRTI